MTVLLEPATSTVAPASTVVCDASSKRSESSPSAGLQRAGPDINGAGADATEVIGMPEDRSVLPRRADIQDRIRGQGISARVFVQRRSMRGGDGRRSGKIERVGDGLIGGREQFAAAEPNRTGSQRAAGADGEHPGRNGRAASIIVGGVDRRDARPELFQTAIAAKGVGERERVVVVDGEFAAIADSAVDRAGRAAIAELQSSSRV